MDDIFGLIFAGTVARISRCKFALDEQGMRHDGQVPLLIIHSSMHFWWNVWPQFLIKQVGPSASAKGSRQIVQPIVSIVDEELKKFRRKLGVWNFVFCLLQLKIWRISVIVTSDVIIFDSTTWSPKKGNLTTYNLREDVISRRYPQRVIAFFLHRRAFDSLLAPSIDQMKNQLWQLNAHTTLIYFVEPKSKMRGTTAGEVLPTDDIARLIHDIKLE